MEGRRAAADEAAGDAEGLQLELEGVLHVLAQTVPAAVGEQAGDQGMSPQQTAAQQDHVRCVGIGQQIDGDGGVGGQLPDHAHREGVPLPVVIQQLGESDAGITRARLRQNGPVGQEAVSWTWKCGCIFSATSG